MDIGLVDKDVKHLLNAMVTGNDADFWGDGAMCEAFLSFVVNPDISRLLQMICRYDTYTYKHSIHVALYSMLLANWSGCRNREIVIAMEAGLMHDIGKTRIPLSILNKTDKLTPEEYEEMKKHTVYGFEMLLEYGSIPDEVKLVALSHHERLDCSGYPSAMGKCLVDEYSQMVAIADIYDAMTTDRCYRSKCTPLQAFGELLMFSPGKLNEGMVRTFLQCLSSTAGRKG